MREGSWSTSALSLVERAVAISAEKRTTPTTLHLLAAVMESPASMARLLRAKGVRVQDLRSAAKVHGEPDGVFERVQIRAFKIAEPVGEVSSLHLVSAALSEPQTAFASMLLQLGCDPLVVAHEVLRESRTPTAPPLTAQTQSVLRAMRAGEAPARQPQSAPTPQRPAASPQRPTPPAPARPMGTTTDPRPIRARPSTNAPNPRGASQKPRGEGHGVFDPRSFPVLSALSASEPTAVEVFEGRQTELARLADALGRREGRGALLVGTSGVGKSTVLRALREARGGAVVVLRHAALVGELRLSPERSRMLCEELGRAAQTVEGFAVALDPMAQWFTTREAPEELVLELRAMLSSARVPWVGALTHDELRRLAELEPWIDRGAVKIELDELPADKSRAAINAHARSLQKHHGVEVSDEISQRAWSLTDRYLGGRAQPDRTLNTLDLALARARRMGAKSLDAQTLAAVVSELGGLPLERVAATDSERLLSLESHLAERVVGHREALARIAQTLRRNAVGFRGQRPIGTFLLLGPTGVGKTETAKAIAEALFPGVGSMSRFDLAEFSEAHSVARLVGAPPGYVGYSDGGQLTEAVRRRPYQLVLLDEIEKAHRDVLEALLALLDEGRMTDGRGRTVDFRNTVVVMTSNLGADAVSEGVAAARAIGFGASVRSDSRPLDVNDRVLASARAALAPELWNRIDETLVYGPLSRAEVSQVATRLLAETFRRLAREQSVQAEATPALIELLLARGGYDPALGARPMRRTISRLVEAPLAEAVLRKELNAGDRVKLDARDGAVVIVREAPAEGVSQRPGVLATTCSSGRKGACGA